MISWRDNDTESLSVSRPDPAPVSGPGQWEGRGPRAGHLIPIFPVPLHIHQQFSTETQDTRTDTMADAYSGIDFDEINEATGLAADEIKCLKVS